MSNLWDEGFYWKMTHSYITDVWLLLTDITLDFLRLIWKIKVLYVNRPKDPTLLSPISRRSNEFFYRALKMSGDSRSN